jgi:hypothetical protein
MLLSKKITIETDCSRSEVLKRLRGIIETKDNQIKDSDYKGEFVKEGFMLVTKMSAAGSMPKVFIFGQFIEAENHIRIIITIQLPTIIKIVFWVFNVILGFQLVARYLSSSKNWPLFLVFLVFLWLFFQFQLWLEVKTLKSTLEPLFVRQIKTSIASNNKEQ